MADPYLASGWHGPEAEHRWMDGPSADILFDPERGERGLVFELRIASFVSAKVARLFVDGALVATAELSAPENLVLALGRPAGNVRIRIEVDDCRSPAEIDPSSQDGRALGIALLGFSLREEESA